MMTYKDKSFCNAECLNIECGRNKMLLNDEDVKRVGLPVSYDELWRECPVYMPIIAESK